MVIQKEVRDLVREIAKKYDISYQDALEIIWSQFKFLRYAMGQGEKGDPDSFETVLLRHLGTFEASKSKIRHMSERFAKKNAKDY